MMEIMGKGMLNLDKIIGVSVTFLIVVVVYGLSVWAEAKARDDYLKRKNQGKQE